MDIQLTKVLSTFVLFLVTAVMEILGCYFPYLILNQGRSHWLWIPTALALGAFVWLLMMSVALAASAVPAFHAAGTDPIGALRDE